MADKVIKSSQLRLRTQSQATESEPYLSSWEGEKGHWRLKSSVIQVVGKERTILLTPVAVDPYLGSRRVTRASMCCPFTSGRQKNIIHFCLQAEISTGRENVPLNVYRILLELFFTETSSWHLFWKVNFSCLLPKSSWRNPSQSRVVVPLLELVMFAQPPVLVLALHGRQTLPRFCLEDWRVHAVSPWQFSLKLNTQFWHLVAPNKLITDFWRLENSWFCPRVPLGFREWTSACPEQGLTHVAAKYGESVSNTYFLILVYCEFSFWWLGKNKGWWFSFNFNLSSQCVFWKWTVYVKPDISPGIS